MIIVEGPDGAGKTTLVQDLHAAFDLPIGQRATKNRDHLYKTTRQDTYTAIAADLVNPLCHVWDRLYYSEFCYAPIVKREIVFTEEDNRVIRPALENQALIVLCLPPFQVVRDNVEKSEQMAGVNMNIGPIWRWYSLLGDRLVKAHRWTVRYDYTRDKSDVLDDFFRGHIAQRKQRTFTPYEGD